LFLDNKPTWGRGDRAALIPGMAPVPGAGCRIPTVLRLTRRARPKSTLRPDIPMVQSMLMHVRKELSNIRRQKR